MCHCYVGLNVLAVGTFLMVVPLVSSIPHPFLDPHRDVCPVGTLKRRRTQHANPQSQGQRHHRQQRENYQMGQMRRWENGLLFALVLPSAYNGSTSFQKVTIYCKIQWTGSIPLDKAWKVFLGLTNSVSTSALRARLAEVHTAFIVNNFSKERQEKKFSVISNLCYVVLSCYIFVCQNGGVRVAFLCPPSVLFLLLVFLLFLLSSYPIQCCYYQHKSRTESQMEFLLSITVGGKLFFFANIISLF